MTELFISAGSQCLWLITPMRIGEPGYSRDAGLMDRARQDIRMHSIPGHIRDLCLWIGNIRPEMPTGEDPNMTPNGDQRLKNRLSFSIDSFAPRPIAPIDNKIFK
jgi:hypothetical protein